MSKQQEPGTRYTTVVSSALIDDVRIEANVSLDFDSIPNFVKKELATVALDAFLRFMQRPDSETILEAERALLQQDGSTLLNRRGEDDGKQACYEEVSE